MAEITRQRQGELVREVLRVLLDRPEGLEARTVIATVETHLGLTDFEKTDYPSTPGVRRFEKILRFGTIPAEASLKPSVAPVPYLELELRAPVLVASREVRRD